MKIRFRSFSALTSVFSAAIMIISPPVLRGQDPQSAPQPAPAAPAAEPKPIRQVRCEVRILEWKLNNTTDRDFAVMLQGDPGSILGSSDLTLPARDPMSEAARVFLSGLDTGSGNFQAVIETLEKAGTVKILAQPSVIMTVGASGVPNPADKSNPTAYSAQVKSNTRIPYPSANALGTSLATITSFRDTGVTLECNAQDIKYDEFVQLQINASLTEPTGFINVNTDAKGNEMRVPLVDSRVIRNQVLVKNGSIFISGLLKSTREIERRQGIPWISELPGLRKILSNKKKSSEVVELVFLVRPEILDPIIAAK
ncbi:hypothetical protein HYR69_11620 [Candidatus Sumerlaeota bacterium]|nr:hypothetical protein [Candidatus Sumerlaeota bacterium]